MLHCVLQTVYIVNCEHHHRIIYQKLRLKLKDFVKFSHNSTYHITKALLFQLACYYKTRWVIIFLIKTMKHFVEVLDC